MPKLRPPSRVEAITFPVFGMTWFGNPGDGTSIVAYCGGGGSAKTGVVNKIVVRDAVHGEMDISTGNQVGVGLLIHQNPETGEIHLLAAVGTSIQKYQLPEGNLISEVDVGDGCNVLAVNPMGTVVAVGCESGNIVVYAMPEDHSFRKLQVLEGHTKAVCALHFALRNPILLSSAKDGTARLWINGKSGPVLKCDVLEADQPPPKRLPQVFVRGCAFGDLEGRVVYTVASAKRGKAFLSRWEAMDASPTSEYTCEVRTVCHKSPVSAVNLSGDGALMAFGSVDGVVTLFDVHAWKPLRTYTEVHELPVTSIAARPYPVPLKGEEDGLQFHAVSASADSKLALITLARRAPKKKTPQPSTGKGASTSHGSITLSRLLYAFLVGWLAYRVGLETTEVCHDHMHNFGQLQRCFVDSVVVAPASRPGIVVPPH